MTAPAYVVVGAGQAGAWVAKTLRSRGCTAPVVVIGEESFAPYERPPLSKAVLKGEAPPASTTLLASAAAAEQGIELWLDERVVSIDRASRSVRCASGRAIGYTKLFLTTGGRARKLPTPALPDERVFYLRTLADAARLQQAIGSVARVLVIGGGWIGLEVAATARSLGCAVDVVEAAPRLGMRTVPPAVAAFLADLHRRHGVGVHTGAPAALAWNGAAIEAKLAGGATLAADLVVIGVGIEPNVELARACGLEVADGVVVDACGRTSDPDVYAAGDVASQPGAQAGRRLRIESWANAQEQAIVAARAALGEAVAYDEIPWFWSDQFDVNLQIIGMPPMDVEPQLRGDPATGPATWFFWRGGRIECAVAVNAGRDIKVVRKWMREGRFPAPEAVLDPGTALQKAAPRAPQRSANPTEQGIA